MKNEKFETDNYIVFKLRFGNWFLYEKETDNEIAESTFQTPLIVMARELQKLKGITMTYTVLYEQDGAIMVSRKMSLDLAQKMCDSYRARDIVAWVEDEENNKVY